MAKIKSRTSDKHSTKPRGVAKNAFERVYWPYIPIILAIGILLSFSISSGNIQAYVRHPAGRVLSYATTMSISGLLSDTNAARSSNGVASLNLNDKLDAAAQANADDMATRDYWSHYTPEGNPPWIWVNNQGYSYLKLGQNLATGFSDEQSTINGWLASPEHRANMLDPTFKDVGFGFANCPNYTAAGGGPMTIIVAFYGEPVSIAQAPSPPPVPASTTPVKQSSPPNVTATNPSSASSSNSTQSNNLPTQTPAIKAATNQSSSPKLAPAVKQSRLQLALKDSQLTSASTSLALVVAIFIGFFWASRHLRTIYKFLLKGERYAVKHPLVDIGLIIIASLLFIMSQLAGIIQ